MERGALIADRYELEEPLGRGGMGEVWSGRDRVLHRGVAVKLLRRDEHAPAELIQRFEREAVAAAQINHPNIVALYDRGVSGDLWYLVMERVEGASLAHDMHEHGPLPLGRALEITSQVCAALVAAHAAGVVHYDIKPSNVMLTAGGSVKVVDFGIAGFTHAHTFTVAPTTLLSPVGTAQYGAPEQFLDQRGDERSDLYALGSLLFTLLTGEPPFGDGGALSLIRRKLDGEAQRVTALRPDVPAAVANLLTELLRRDPEARPRSASDVHECLAGLHRKAAVPAGERDGAEPKTSAVPEPTATRPLTAAPDKSDPGPDVTPRGSTDAGTTARRRPTGRTLPVLVATGLLAITLTTYYADAWGDDPSSPNPTPTFTPARYQRMPDLCSYLQRNDMRGREELPAEELLDDGNNNSKQANCGWASPDSQKFNTYQMIVSAQLYSSKEAATKALGRITLGRRSGDSPGTTKVLEEVGDHAVRSIMDESRRADGKFNSSWVYFRQENLMVTVWYSEDVRLHESGSPERVADLARGQATSLDRFVTEEPENREKPVWG
ncbi:MULTISPECIES: serine/threonine protein kinase [Streptomyces]|uniref:non-specific serine/threonine protein kinase n=1 Tax=Streptomyces glycanivorans TaxID=3033808 RepID=A0ABY9JQD3_9ACTN|nr:protein kinase [Streptomyces sp. Alt3]WLQ69310.1 protein kinase [Streptomyces sp. Alt3]